MLGDKAAAARYIAITSRKITQLIYPKKFCDVLPYDISETEDNIVPEYLFSVIPMVLVNGCSGIGTGYSTSIPKYHPNEIC